MRRAFAIVLVLASCAEPAATEHCDAGVGPLGSCKPPRDCQDTCGSDAECGPEGTCARDPDGCRRCEVFDPPVEDGGTSCSSTTCIQGDECCSGMLCVRPGDELCGGACRPNECESDADCADGSRCDATSACGCNGPFRACVPPCPANPCADGESCSGGLCVPIRCPAFPCSGSQECLSTGGDAHGCAPKTCASDRDCPGAFCVSGECLPAGTCTFLPP